MSSSTSAGIESTCRRLLRSLLLALAIGCLPLPEARADAGDGEILLLAVRINDVEADPAAWVLRLPDGAYCVTGDSLAAWRLRPGGAGMQVGERIFFRLDDIDGIGYWLDPASQTLSLTVSASAFVANGVSLYVPAVPALSPVAPGVFLNYDVQLQRAASQDRAGGLFELGAFNRWGAGNLTALWDNGRMQGRMVRLDTAWTVDFPAAMRRLRVGDAISTAGSWGRALRFGGLQWGSNFSSQPNFVPFALPAIRGAASLPSTVDVYIDNVQQLHSDVQAGPFDLRNVPVVTGQGEMQLAVRDQLGRQQIITQPYYVSPALLKPGLHDFSVEVGVQRRDYGSAQANYGAAMLVANDRLGLGPEFTREVRAELLADRQTVGVGGVWLLPHLGTGSLNAAVSHGRLGEGRLFGVGVERQARDLSFGLRAQYAGRNFTQAGLLPGTTPRQSLLANVGLPIAGSGLGLAYLQQAGWEGDRQKAVSASYSWRLGGSGQLALLALRDFGSLSSTTLALTFIVAVDERTSISAEIGSYGSRAQETAQLQRNLPAGDGFAYRLLAGRGQYERFDAAGTWQTAGGLWTAEAAGLDGRSAYRVGASGGVVAAGGGVFAGRRLDDSFAIVKVGDFAGVRVSRDNQEIGRTDGNGLILITRLRAYQENPIAIEQADLPLDAEIDRLQLKLIPALRSGVLAEFPVRRGRAASFTLVDESGRVLPPGTGLTVVGLDRKFNLGYDGRAFVTGLSRSGVRLEVEGKCSAVLAWEDGSEAVPELGTVICRRAP